MNVGAPLLAGVIRDLRYAGRVMRKKPGFTALAVITLALGIGVNTASVAVAYGILVRPLPYAEPSRVVLINLLFPDGGDLGFSPAVLQEWLPRLRTTAAAAGYYRREVTVRSGGRGTVVPAAFVTEAFFDVLGTSPARGHQPSSRDSGEAVISARKLQEILRGGDVGTLVSIGDVPHTIAAVMPSEFALPDDEIGIWLRSPALAAGTRPEKSGYSKIVARLKPGVTLDQLRADVNRVRLELNPKSRDTVAVDVLGESVVGSLRKILLMTIAGAFLVLLVACANVATLFIGRDVARQRELGARMALGATAHQLVRSVLIETLLIALIASVVGAPLGAVALKLFVTQAAASISGLHRVVIGFPVFLCAAVLTVVATLICAAVPAWHAARADFSPFLRTGAGSVPRLRGIRAALVVAQIALSCVLLIGAGLLARTVSVLMHQDHGFEPNGAIEAKIVLSDVVLFDGAGGQAFVQRLLERVRAMPGVQHAGFGTNLPPRLPPITMGWRFIKDNRDETRFFKVGAGTPDYLRALGARFVEGRDFTAAEDATAASVVILSESAARFYFPGQSAVGQTISPLPKVFGVPGTPRVIGVVSDIKYEGLDAPAPGALYLPWRLRPLGSGYLIVRAAGDPMRLAGEIRRAAQALDPAIPIAELQTLTAALTQSIATRRVRALPPVGFGLLAVAVAFVGVLATLSTLIAERRRDLAIRAALGASSRHLTWTVVRQGLALTAAGLVVGVAFGSAAVRALASLVYGISPYDFPTFAGTALLVGGGAMITTYAAARRVHAVDPLMILRDE
jgi:putative ABC transport system permease protein